MKPTFFIIFLIVFSSLKIHSQNVFYGERNLNDKDPALYFDKDGFPYPDYRIADSLMQKAYGSLFTVFLQNGEEFISVSARYDLFPEKIDSETIYQLRDSINAVNSRKINRYSTEFSSVAFYLHGYRKAFTKQNKDVTSAEEFALLRSNLASYTSEKPLEVEVYWDGMYDCCFSMKQKKNKQLYKMFETAGRNALNAGLGLRRVLNLVESDSIQIIAHSLGSKVAHSALFDYGKGDVITPQQKSVRVVYLAPALDASDFLNYYDERQNTGSENYHFLIVYNEKDFVLKKKDPKIGVFGPGVNKYGCTSLGCNKKNRTIEMSRKMKEKYITSDIRLLDKTSLGKAHSLRAYVRENNLKEVSDFLNGK